MIQTYFEQQCHLLQQIADITQQMMSACETYNFDDLGPLIQSRGELMTRIDKCDHMIRQYINEQDEHDKLILSSLIENTFEQLNLPIPDRFDTIFDLHQSSIKLLLDISQDDISVQNFIKSEQKELIKQIADIRTMKP